MQLSKFVVRLVRTSPRIAQLDVHRNSNEWREIQIIRELRNKIAHQDGRLVTNRGTAASDIIFVHRELSVFAFLHKHGQEVMLHQGFLKYTVDMLNAYFQLMGESIKAAHKV